MMEKEVKKEQLPDWHRKVLSVIRPGKSNAITVKSIISLVGGTDTSIRKTISDLVIKYNYKIAGSNDASCPGFYIIQNEEERQEAISNLVGRINQMAIRINALRDNSPSVN